MVIVVVLVLILVLIGRRDSAPTSSEPIKIGADLPMTGIAAIYGEHQKNAISLAVEEINNDGGVLGRPLEVIYEDDGTEAKQAVSVVNKLISVDNAPVIIGATWDFLAGAVMPVIDSQKRILITPSASQDMIESTSSYHFTTYMAISSNRGVVEKYLSKFRQPKAVIIYANNYWGKAHGEMFKKALENSGGVLVKEVVLPKFDNNDMQRELSLIKASGADVVLGALNYNDVVTFSKRRTELGIAAPVLAHANFANAYYDKKISAGSLKDISIFRPALPKTDFVEKYQQKFDKSPLAEADSAYDAVYAVKYAIEEVGKTDSESILTGLRQIDFVGASGRIDYPELNYPVNKLPILQTFNGQDFVTLK